MKPPNRAPAYAAMYPILAEIAREHGYAVAIHGTMARDFDLIACPWIDTAAEADTLVRALADAVGRQAGDDPVIGYSLASTPRPHGRVGYSIPFDLGEHVVAYIDLAVMPRAPSVLGEGTDAPGLLAAARKVVGVAEQKDVCGAIWIVPDAEFQALANATDGAAPGAGDAPTRCNCECATHPEGGCDCGCDDSCPERGAGDAGLRSDLLALAKEWEDEAERTGAGRRAQSIRPRRPCVADRGDARGRA